jgi:hypothetical protein
MTGDVFRDMDIPGIQEVDSDQPRLIMIVSHPCSMREDGYTLKAALQAICVRRAPAIELGAWKQHYDRMPLPNLFHLSQDDDVVNEDDSYAAFFDLRGRAKTSEMGLDARVACLSEEGVGYLHQRMGHADTRYAARVHDLVAACAAPFIEAELLEEWNLAADVEGLDPSSRDKALLAAAKEFDGILAEVREKPAQTSGKNPIRYRLREDLAMPRKVPGARREVRRIMRERGGSEVRPPGDK